MLDMPYFMTNPEWYTINPKNTGNGYLLTDKAPAKAIESYNDYYKLYNIMYPNQGGHPNG